MAMTLCRRGDRGGSSEGQLGRTSRTPGTMPVTWICYRPVRTHNNLLSEASVVVLHAGEERDSEFLKYPALGFSLVWFPWATNALPLCPASDPSPHFSSSHLSFPSIFFWNRELDPLTLNTLRGADPRMLHSQPKGKTTQKMNLKSLLFTLLLFSVSRVTPVREVLNICEKVPLHPGARCNFHSAGRQGEGGPQNACPCFLASQWTSTLWNIYS